MKKLIPFSAAFVMLLSGILFAQHYAGSGADGVANTAISYGNSAGDSTNRLVAAAKFLFNGTTWDRQRSAAAANTSTSIGASLSEKGTRWQVISQVAGQASAAKAAGGAGVKHVVDCIGWSAASAGAVTAGNLSLNVRDGATGAGTVIWQHFIAFPTAGAAGVQEVAPHNFCGLNLVGTANTAMTIEFSGSITNATQEVVMSGYDVQ